MGCCRTDELIRPEFALVSSAAPGPGLRLWAAWRLCSLTLQVPTVDTQTLECWFSSADQVAAVGAKKRPASTTAEVDHLPELVVVHAIWATHGSFAPARFGLSRTRQVSTDLHATSTLLRVDERRRSVRQMSADHGSSYRRP